jgi:hypothetical protein
MNDLMDLLMPALVREIQSRVTSGTNINLASAFNKVPIQQLKSGMLSSQ